MKMISMLMCGAILAGVGAGTGPSTAAGATVDWPLSATGARRPFWVGAFDVTFPLFAQVR